VTSVRPAQVRRGPLAVCAVLIVVFALVFGLVAIGSSALGALTMFVLFSGVTLLVTWLLTLRLERSTFVIDHDGMEVRTPRGRSRVAWSDADGVTVAPEHGEHLLLATLQPGAAPPAPSAIGLPRWSIARRCLIVMKVESFNTTSAEVRTALRRYAGDAFRADGRL
jgi:hypothetical protein